MIEPPPCCAMRGAAREARYQGPLVFTSNTFWNSSGVRSERPAVTGFVPALLIRMSMRPKRA